MPVSAANSVYALVVLVVEAMLTLIHTAKLNGVDPQAWLADVLARIADHKITELAALLPSR